MGEKTILNAKEKGVIQKRLCTPNQGIQKTKFGKSQALTGKWPFVERFVEMP